MLHHLKVQHYIWPTELGIITILETLKFMPLNGPHILMLIKIFHSKLFRDEEWLL